MTSSIPRFSILALLPLLAFVPVHAAETAGKTPGDLWEVTSKMSMEGMPMEMPSQKQQVCSAKEWTQPPASNTQGGCTNTDFKMTGGKATWKVKCTNPPMTGEGEITRNGSDAWTGSIRFTSPDGVMTLKLSGRRVGDCDAKP